MDEGELYGKIYEVLTNQLFGVLATVENGVPKAVIVPFTVTNNLKTILFLTKHHTDKFKNLENIEPVTILVDHRPHSSKRITGDFAVSATGIAKAVDLSGATATKELFLFCHPSLAEYLANPEYALLSMHVKTYDVSNGISEVHPYKMG
ncbi:MAG: pyridoxamine 5'-phosphate oxidase family protein [Fibrobacter sp.]|nr:pyridoxamine 5'-phosphate oxidase family protein [Fibrobacter sp.]